ncbi:MAG: cupin domain-containing protein [bacterium]|nr:cupin domain-containing protein [bacterium]
MSIIREVLAHGGNLMLTKNIFTIKGTKAETHTHHHEQISFILSGSFKFTLNKEERILNVGDSLYIPSNIPHSAEALEDNSIVLDVFTPQREDFLR